MIRKRYLSNEIKRLEHYFKWLKNHDEDQGGKIITLQWENKQLQKQLQCAAKGHNFVFDKILNKDLGWKWLLRKSKDMKPKYQFKCTNCDLTITKTIDELTATEKKALKDLGILEEEKENGESPTTEN
jgi:hypothetical protein